MEQDEDDEGFVDNDEDLRWSSIVRNLASYRRLEGRVDLC